MRLKAGAPDYRYFPEPDLPPLELDEAWVEEIRAALPELPLAREERYRSALGLTAYDAGVLVRAPHLAQVFEETVAIGHEPQLVANWVTGEYARFARQGSTVSGKLLGLLELIAEGQSALARVKRCWRRCLPTVFPHGSLWQPRA